MLTSQNQLIISRFSDQQINGLLCLYLTWPYRSKVIFLNKFKEAIPQWVRQCSIEPRQLSSSMSALDGLSGARHMEAHDKGPRRLLCQFPVWPLDGATGNVDKNSGNFHNTLTQHCCSEIPETNIFLHNKRVLQELNTLKVNTFSKISYYKVSSSGVLIEEQFMKI